MSAEYVEQRRKNREPLEILPILTKEIQESIEITIKHANEMLRELIKNGYYNRVSITFRCQVYETLLFFEATKEDLSLLSVIGSQTYFYYLEEFNRISRTANNLNTTLRFTWKTDSYPDDYTTDYFLVLSDLYQELAAMFEILEKLDDVNAVLKSYGMDPDTLDM